MENKKLCTAKELYCEKHSGSPTKHVIMLEHNNRLLTERLKAAIGFLELQETHLPEYIGFMWREVIIEEK